MDLVSAGVTVGMASVNHIPLEDVVRYKHLHPELTMKALADALGIPFNRARTGYEIWAKSLSAIIDVPDGVCGVIILRKPGGTRDWCKLKPEHSGGHRANNKSGSGGVKVTEPEKAPDYGCCELCGRPFKRPSRYGVCGFTRKCETERVRRSNITLKYNKAAYDKEWRSRPEVIERTRLNKSRSEY